MSRDEQRPNPAVVPEPPDTTAREKQYRVAGPRRVLEHDPGETFRALIDPQLEAFLVEVGHIEVVPAKPARPTTRTLKED